MPAVALCIWGCRGAGVSGSGRHILGYVLEFIDSYMIDKINYESM